MRATAVVVVAVLIFGSVAFAEEPARREIAYTGPVKLNPYARRDTGSTDASARAATWRYYYSAPSCGYYASCYAPYAYRRGGYGRFIFVGFSHWGGCW